MNTKDFNFKKKYGQNFLRDNSIPRKIVDVSKIPDNTLVIEIGPGAGALTKELAKVAKQVLCYEIDESLEDILDQALLEDTNVSVIYDDFLKRNVLEDLNNYDYEHLYVIANLPYYVTTPIITQLVTSNLEIEKIVVMVQKEVADRMNAKPSTKDYGALSVAVQYYCDTEIVAKAPRHMFVPQPNVDSIVIGLHVRDEKKYVVDNEDIFFKTVKASFGQRRKTLLNSLGGLGFLSKDQIKEALKAANIDEKRRGETLSIDEFANLSNEINKFSSK